MSNWTLKEKSMGDLEVVIDSDSWKKATQKAFNKIARNVVIPGFRKGQAPKNLISKRIGDSEVFYQAIDDNANEWMRAALSEQDLNPISQPQLDIKDVNRESATLIFTFAVEPEAAVGDYKSLKYDPQPAEVTDEDINKEIDRLRNNYADMEVKDGEAEDGDTVNIDYEGFKDDVAFDGGKAENYDLTLGSGSFIPGFEEKLVGVKAGDEKDLNLTFPEDYHAADLAGADVVFKVKVNEVKKKVVPELDDDFAADLNYPEVETVEQLKEFLKKRMSDERMNEAKTEAESELFKQLVEMTDVDLPDVMVEEETQNLLNQFASQIQGYGMSLSKYMEMLGMSTDDLKAQYQEQAVANLKGRLALSAVAKAENITADEDEIEKELDNIAAMYSMDKEEVRKLIAPSMLAADIVNQKALDVLKGTKTDSAE